MGLQRGQIVAVVAVICAALGYLVYTGIRDNMVFYYTVSEVQVQQTSLGDRPLRVAGKVVPGTIAGVGSNHVHRDFVIREGGSELLVRYRGSNVLPDTLVDEADAVVEGRLGEDGVFHATFVMAKCPSKYESEKDFSKYREREAGVAPAGGPTAP